MTNKLAEAAGGAADFLPIGAHPAAELFPMMSDEELAEQAEDIKRPGLVPAVYAVRRCWW